MNYINTFDRNELTDILISSIVLIVAMAVLLFRDGINTGGLNLAEFSLATATLTVLTGFLFHELSHRQVARRLGGYAVFKRWDLGILLALVTSLFGFLFAAPGAVYFSGLYDRESVGKVALSGPAMNMIAGLVLFLSGVAISGSTGFSAILVFSGRLNFWLLLFNMIPVWQLDGAKVFHWSKELYILFLAVAVLLVVLSGTLFYI
ncbi:MAG: peptidase [Thermoplasmataceae archaeon]|jgi:Zn-dependent protease